MHHTIDRRTLARIALFATVSAAVPKIASADPVPIEPDAQTEPTVEDGRLAEMEEALKYAEAELADLTETRKALSEDAVDALIQANEAYAQLMWFLEATGNLPTAGDIVDSGDMVELVSSRMYIDAVRTHVDMRSESMEISAKALADLADDLSAQLSEAIEVEGVKQQEVDALRAQVELMRQNVQAASADPGATIADGDLPEREPVVIYESEPVVVYEEAGDSGYGYYVSTPNLSTVDWSMDKIDFVWEWGARIDAYLDGFPLGGHGETFAAAAYDYGIDPRWSPAISCIESTKGLYCFLPFNAWGWGHVTWPDWDTAIYEHVKGLAEGYGPTFEYEDALKYCPPTADSWYAGVCGEMEKI